MRAITIVKRKDFIRIQRIGKQWRLPHLVVRYIHADRYLGDDLQVGWVISKKVGSSVRRNQIRRQLRDAWLSTYRQYFSDIIGLNMQVALVVQSSWNYDRSSLLQVMQDIFQKLIQGF